MEQYKRNQVSQLKEENGVYCDSNACLNDNRPQEEQRNKHTGPKPACLPINYFFKMKVKLNAGDKFDVNILGLQYLDETIGDLSVDYKFSIKTVIEILIEAVNIKIY